MTQRVLPQETTDVKAIHTGGACIPRACIPVLVSAHFNPMNQEHFATDKPNELSVAHESFPQSKLDPTPVPAQLLLTMHITKQARTTHPVYG